MALLLMIVLFSGGPSMYLLLSENGFPHDDNHMNDMMLLAQKVNATLEAFIRAETEKRVTKQELMTLLERTKSIEESMASSSIAVANGSMNAHDVDALVEQVASLTKRIQIHDEASIKKNDIDIATMNEKLSLLERLHQEGSNNDVEKSKLLRQRMSTLEQGLQTHHDTSVQLNDVQALKDYISSLEQKNTDMTRGEEEHDSSLDYGTNNETFCVSWSVDMDEWWTHHPTWSVSKENQTHQCFSPMGLTKKAVFFQKLHDIQFHSVDCSNMTTKRTYNSGFGADMRNVVDGLQYAVETNQPMQIYTPRYWKYAHLQPNRSACPTRDMFCYFLNLTRCEPNPKFVQRKQLTQPTPLYTVPGTWYYEFATRQQTWLRHEVYKFSSKINIKTPCTVAHVRRADTVLHKAQTRRYHEIDEYVHAMSNDTRNIFLLTDDANAISEAIYKFPKYNWMYIDRPRHRGSEGGWENQTPSNDPKFEVIVLLSIFRLVKKCSTLVHTKSGFASLLLNAMGARIERINIDTGPLYHPDHALTVNISKPYPAM